jgi:spermidine synthase
VKLSTHIAQGELIYLSNDENKISIAEDEHYRWLAFGDTIQSIMHKRCPKKLTLPHQIAILLPLLFFKPKTMLELGLGGGNLGRYIRSLHDDIALTSVELSANVIECFHRYFNPNAQPFDITQTSAMLWLTNNNKPVEYDWLICDVYQHHTGSFQEQVQLLTALVDNLTLHGCLTINLPDSTDQEINLCLTILQQLQNSHQIIYFHIPNYLNIIIQLIPNHWNISKLSKKTNRSYLPITTYKRWQKFWPHHHAVNERHRFSNKEK